MIGPQSTDELITQARESLGKPPITLNGLGKGKLYEVAQSFLVSG